MKYVHSASSDIVRDTILERIRSPLKLNIPVLFLVSGGSSAGIAVDVCRTLLQQFADESEKLKELLTVSLIDERFGPSGHKDSNWELLEARGLIAKNYTSRPVLSDKTGVTETLEKTVERFNGFLMNEVQKTGSEKPFIAGLFGIGPDGHTAGILPGSPASFLEAAGSQYACGYESSLFTRITITPAFFPHIDFAVVYAAGTAKIPALEKLHMDIPAQVQPAQLLKHARETIIFSDSIPAQQKTN